MEQLLNTTIIISVTALIILMVKVILKNKISPKWQFALWAIVAIRLMIPILPQSDLSIFNTVPQVEYRQQEAYNSESPLNSNIPSDKGHIEKSNAINTTGPLDVVKTDRQFSISKFLLDNITTIGITGSVVLLIHLIGVYFIYSLKIKKLKIVKNPEILSVLDECKTRLGISTHITVREGGETPLLKGLLNPEIILPKGYTTDELKSVFTHELSHLKHKDVLWNIVGTLLLCIHWYNPIIWYCFIVFKRDMEILCDYRVLQVYDNRKAYANVLLKTALNKNRFILATTCMQNGKKDISKRIKYIAYFKKPKVIWSIITFILVAVIMTGCLTNPTGQTDDKNLMSTEIDYERIYDHKTLYVGDASKVGNLSSNLYYSEYKTGISLQTEGVPYEATINYTVESGDIVQDDNIKLTDKMLKNAAIMFCLIDNVDEINFNFDDGSSIYRFPIKRELINEIFKGDIRSYSSSFDKFRNEFIPMIERENWNDLDFEVYITNKVELYMWKDKDITGTDDVYYIIFPGTNMIKDEEDIYNLEKATNDLAEVNEYLTQYQYDAYLSIKHDSSLSKEDMMKLDESIIFKGQSRSIGGFGDFLESNDSNDDIADITDKVKDSIRLGMLNTTQKTVDIENKVEYLLQTIMSSPLTSSAPGDYIKEHQKEYETILKLGDDALVYMLAEFERGKNEGLKGHIMMLLCIEILGDRNNVENLEDGTYYSPREWYSMLSINEAVNLPLFKIRAQNDIERRVYFAALNQYSSSWNEKSVIIVAPRIFGTYETDNELRIFTTVYYSEYNLYGKNLSQESGGVVPAAIIYTKNDAGGYDFKEYIEAMDGSYFQSSIEEFCEPRDDIAREIMSHYGNYGDLFETMKENLIYYLEENDMKGIGLKEHDGTIIPLT